MDCEVVCGAALGGWVGEWGTDSAFPGFSPSGGDSAGQGRGIGVMLAEGSWKGGTAHTLFLAACFPFEVPYG